MKSSRIIAIILIIAGLVLGYMGIDQVAKSDSSVDVLGLKIEASNESGKQQGYIYIGLAVVLFAGGLYTLNKK